MNKEKVNILGHLVAGLILLFHGFDAFEAGDLKSAAGYLGFSILFMLVAGLYNTINRNFFQGNAAFFLLEAVTIFYSAWHYKLKGQPYLYYIMTFAAVIYLVFTSLSFASNDSPKRKKSRKKRRKSHSSSSLISGGRNNPNHSISSPDNPE